MPERELGDAPTYFTPEQVSAWEELKAATAPGVLTLSDRFILEIATRLLSEYRTSVEFGIVRLQTFISCLTRMGMTPADRSKIQVLPAPKEDRWNYLDRCKKGK